MAELCVYEERGCPNPKTSCFNCDIFMELLEEKKVTVKNSKIEKLEVHDYLGDVKRRRA